MPRWKSMLSCHQSSRASILRDLVDRRLFIRRHSVDHIPHRLQQSALGPGEFRLLRFSGGSRTQTGDELMTFETQVFKLSQAPSFQALSYTCGPPGLKPRHENGKLVAFTEPEISDFPGARVVCDGDETTVSANMFGGISTLIAVGAISAKGWVWVDALCICQTDLEEKAQQVMLMRNIFATAEEVLIWLGDRAKVAEGLLSPEQLIEFIDNFETAYSEWEESTEEASWRHLIQGSSFVSGKLGEAVGIAYLGEKMVAFCIFCASCRWFSRLWTIQELVVARRKRMFWGDKEIDWSKLSTLARYIKHFGWTPHLDYFMRTVVSLRRDWLEGVRRVLALEQYANANKATKPEPIDTFKSVEVLERQKFVHLGVIFSVGASAACMDPRDRVFGLIGVAQPIFGKDDVATHVLVDYTKPVEDVFRETSRMLLSQSRSLNILANSGGPEDCSRRYLPTWALDYRVGHSQFATGAEHGFHASAGLHAPEPPFHIGNSILSCHGYRFDVVRATCQTKTNIDVDYDAKFDLAGAMLNFVAALPGRINGRRRAEVLWRTSTLNRSVLGNEPPESTELSFWSWVAISRISTIANSGCPFDRITQAAIPEIKALIECFELCQGLAHRDIIENAVRYSRVWEQMAADAEFTAYDELAQSQQEQENYLQAHEQNGGESRLMATQRDLLAVGTATVQEGDEIWILATADVPFLLRPQTVSGTYKFVGTCFILDHMHGETLDERYGTISTATWINIL